jgi:hypothetical protein
LEYERAGCRGEPSDVMFWILKRLERMMAATQAEVDALTQTVGQIATDLQNATTAIQQELNSLASGQNPAIDLTALQNAVAPLDAQVQTLGQLKPQG